jgi:hypothetical protein
MLKAIVGGSIGGIATAHYLEELFDEQISKQIEIDIFEKENDLREERRLEDEKIALNNNLLHYRGYVYDINPLNFVNLTDFYIKKFGQKSGIYNKHIF